MKANFYREYQLKFYLNMEHFIIINGEKGQTHSHTWEFSLNIRFGKSSFQEFTTFEKGIAAYLDKYQNHVLNDFEPFQSIIPTLENVTDIFAEDFFTIIHDIGGILLRVEASETPTRRYIVNIGEQEENAVNIEKTDEQILSDVMDSVIDEMLK